MMPDRVLIVDDDTNMCQMLETDLKLRGFQPASSTSATDALDRLAQDDYDVVLTDLRMPGTNGLEFCHRVTANRPHIPVVVMTAFGSMETAIEALRAGAYDFVTKPIDTELLAAVLKRAIEHRRLQAEVRRLSEAVKGLPNFEQMVGESEVMRKLFREMGRVADSETSVLITGESGTGKELVARALHDHSRRAEGPFVAINCAALPEPLLESELFGHAKGAFTDARVASKGLILEADRGTLFLDEIGELPLTLQPKLLRVLEERTVRPVGGTREMAFDVRIVAATNRDLESAVDDGRFREDLYYRINVIQLTVPPLSARGSDVLLLAQHFLERFAKRSRKNVRGISPQVAERLLAYSWPGNVRELRNAIERAVALTRQEMLIVDDLPEKIRGYRRSQLTVAGDNPTELLSLEAVERRYILHVLKTVGGNRSAAARILGLDRKTLYRKLQRYGQIADEK